MSFARPSSGDHQLPASSHDGDEVGEDPQDDSSVNSITTSFQLDHHENGAIPDASSAGRPTTIVLDPHPGSYLLDDWSVPTPVEDLPGSTAALTGYQRKPGLTHHSVWQSILSGTWWREILGGFISIACLVSIFVDLPLLLAS